MRYSDHPKVNLIIKHITYIVVGLVLFLLWTLIPTVSDGQETTAATSTLEIVVEVASTTAATSTVVEYASSTSDKIRFYSDKYNLNTELNLKVAKAESRFKNVCNYKYTSESGRYTACGIYQITRTTYKSFCGDPKERFDVDKNIECAMVIMSESGYHHWNESAYAWKK